ncbi:Bromodomain-containing protein 9 [Smittium mucronatum]|uniref:Bromodomain-containing protein 9 n=1 Tax=Smittium mucronatum TaxID=133383 RepID=A0A1R0GY38_9FUNG|nr:Bromodomain-containing protein 9 [Smittium mucronatum]
MGENTDTNRKADNSAKVKDRHSDSDGDRGSAIDRDRDRDRENDNDNDNDNDKGCRFSSHPSVDPPATVQKPLSPPAASISVHKDSANNEIDVDIDSELDEQYLDPVSTLSSNIQSSQQISRVRSQASSRPNIKIKLVGLKSFRSHSESSEKAIPSADSLPILKIKLNLRESPLETPASSISSFHKDKSAFSISPSDFSPSDLPSIPCNKIYPSSPSRQSESVLKNEDNSLDSSTDVAQLFVHSISGNSLDEGLIDVCNSNNKYPVESVHKSSLIVDDKSELSQSFSHTNLNKVKLKLKPLLEKAKTSRLKLISSEDSISNTCIKSSLESIQPIPETSEEALIKKRKVSESSTFETTKEISIDEQLLEYNEVLHYKFDTHLFGPILSKLIKKLFRKDFYGIFWEPVNLKEVTDYLKVVSSPMDLGTMRSKAEDNQYSTLDQFIKDFKLICNNALIYNHPSTVYYQHAQKFLAAGFAAIFRSARKLASKLTLLRNSDHLEAPDLPSLPDPTSPSRLDIKDSEISIHSPGQSPALEKSLFILTDNNNPNSGLVGNLSPDIKKEYDGITTDTATDLIDRIGRSDTIPNNHRAYSEVNKKRPTIPIFKIKNSSPLNHRPSIRRRGPGKATETKRRLSEQLSKPTTNPDGSLVMSREYQHNLLKKRIISHPVMLCNSNRPLQNADNWRKATHQDFINYPIVLNNGHKPNPLAEDFLAAYGPASLFLAGGEVGMAYYLSILRFVSDTGSVLLKEYLATVLNYLSNRVYSLILAIACEKNEDDGGFLHLGFERDELDKVMKWIQYSATLYECNEYLLESKDSNDLFAMKRDFGFDSSHLEPADVKPHHGDIETNLKEVSTILYELSCIKEISSSKLDVAREGISRLLSLFDK